MEVYRGIDGYWRYRVKAGNGEILAQSESYASKQNAVRGAVDLAKAITEGQSDTATTFIEVNESFTDDTERPSDN